MFSLETSQCSQGFVSHKIQRLTIKLQKFEFTLFCRPFYVFITRCEYDHVYPPPNTQTASENYDWNTAGSSVERKLYTWWTLSGPGQLYSVLCPWKWTVMCKRTIDERITYSDSRKYAQGNIPTHTRRTSILGEIYGNGSHYLVPGLCFDIEQLLNICSVCQKHRYKQPKEPMLIANDAIQPMEKARVDLFQLDGKDHLLVIDYMYNYSEVAVLICPSSNEIIKHLKYFFARHGIPRRVVVCIKCTYETAPQYLKEQSGLWCLSLQHR